MTLLPYFRLLFITRFAVAQTNGYDCGAFLCQNVLCVAQGRACSYKQSDLPVVKVRRCVALSIHHQRIVYDELPDKRPDALSA